MILWFTTYIYLLCNGDDKPVNRCSREHATITSCCCNFKGIYLRKKNGTKWKHRSLAKSDKLLKQGFKDWQRNGFFENHEKRYVVTTGQPHRGVAHGACAKPEGDHKSKKEQEVPAKPLLQPGTHWFQFVQPVRPPRKSLSLRRIERYVFLWVISAHEPI